MKKFPGDAVCRSMLVYLLCRQERYTEAEGPFREAEALAPNDPYVHHFAVRLGFATPAAGDSSELDQPPPHFHLRPDRWGQPLEPGRAPGEGESLAPWPDFSMPHFYDRPNLREQESNQDDSPAVPPTATDVTLAPRGQTATTGPTVPTAPEAVLPSGAAVLEHYLAQLMKRLPWLEHYFTDGTPNVSEADDGSELALVVEYRRSAQPEIALAGKLNLAAQLRPGAYSVQMLHAWQHREQRDWSRALVDLAKAFPEQRLHDLLRYPDLSVVEQERVLDAFQNKRGKQNNAAPAGQEKSRLASVYPQLFGRAELPHTNPQALQRLVEDIAFACSDETVPAVPT